MRRKVLADRLRAYGPVVQQAWIESCTDPIKRNAWIALAQDRVTGGTCLRVEHRASALEHCMIYVYRDCDRGRYDCAARLELRIKLVRILQQSEQYRQYQQTSKPAVRAYHRS